LLSTAELLASGIFGELLVLIALEFLISEHARTAEQKQKPVE
jgi:hypothetical protein